ncbi:MAG: hypothetical protein ACOYXT_14670 [Bacteroidota bacterium]
MATAVKTRARKTSLRRPQKSRADAKNDLAKTYNKFKKFEGQPYPGMKVGRGHKWYYDKGEWKEKKLHPISGILIML